MKGFLIAVALGGLLYAALNLLLAYTPLLLLGWKPW